jgi:hypothetical protein
VVGDGCGVVVGVAVGAGVVVGAESLLPLPHPTRASVRQTMPIAINTLLLLPINGALLGTKSLLLLTLSTGKTSGTSVTKPIRSFIFSSVKSSFN